MLVRRVEPLTDAAGPLHLAGDGLVFARLVLSNSSLDLYARRIVGWAPSNKPDADLVIKALDMAYEQRGRP